MKSPSKYQLQSVVLVDFPTLCAVCCAFHFLSAICHFIASIRTHTHTPMEDKLLIIPLQICCYFAPGFGEERSGFCFLFGWTDFRNISYARVTRTYCWLLLLLFCFQSCCFIWVVCSIPRDLYVHKNEHTRQTRTYTQTSPHTPPKLSSFICQIQIDNDSKMGWMQRERELEWKTTHSSTPIKLLHLNPDFKQTSRHFRYYKSIETHSPSFPFGSPQTKSDKRHWLSKWIENREIERKIEWKFTDIWMWIDASTIEHVQLYTEHTHEHELDYSDKLSCRAVVYPVRSIHSNGNQLNSINITLNLFVSQNTINRWWLDMERDRARGREKNRER